MAFSRQVFFGTWDVYAGPMHSVLQLDENGAYRHSLMDNVHQHWGTWDIETQNRTEFLVLHLQDAAPRMDMGPFGWQPVAWPAFEAWPIAKLDENHIFSPIATMVRQNLSWPAPPPYQPLPQPLTMQAPISPASAPLSTMPTPAPKPSPTPPPAPPVMQQWAVAHSDWNQIRQIFAQTLQQDMKITQEINDMYATQHTSELASAMKNTQAMSDAVHEGAQAFIAALRKR